MAVLSKTNRSHSLNNILRIPVILLLLASPFIAWQHRWNIYDTWRLRGYNPPDRIVQIADQTSMSDSTRRLFYVYHPELNDKSTFRDRCSGSEKTIILGCYVRGKGIYIYNVTDPRLDGVIQVTAAHEALHSAYDRLSSSEKDKLKSLIDTTFNNLDNPRIKSSIELYRKDGADIHNELHSILGTEVRTLPTELEQYYSRYFQNRLSIVALSEKYEAAFTERKQRIADYDAELASLKNQIESSEKNLNAMEQNLQAERARLDVLLAAKRYDEYNAGVSSFNSQVNTYNREVIRVRSLIDRYNVLVKERNLLAEEEGELVKAIDSRPDTIQSE